ncbi:hypothetical protein TOTORO_02870 [Serratia phage vB_SmaS-Totoro]|nr:hypothetical protein TOTORO_02870 [Serratia phage vB_SmaS-Totoro]
MKFTKSILSKRPAPAVESEVIDQAKIDQLAAQNADKDEVATGGEGIQSAEQQPDTTKDVTMAEVDEVIAGETNPIKDDGANKDTGNGTSDEVADEKGVSEVENTESKDESGTAPTEGKPDPEAEENEAVATGEETAASNEDAAAAVAAELNAEPDSKEEEETAEQEEEAANAEEEASTEEEQNAEEEAAAAAEDEAAGEPAAAEAEADASADDAVAADVDADAAATDEAAAQEAEIDAAADQAAADAASDVAAEPVEPPAVEVEPGAEGETTGADEVAAPAGEVTEQPLEEPAAVIVEQPSEEPVGETEIVVATGDAVDGVQQTEEAAVVTAPVEVPAAVTEPAEAAPDFVAVAESTDGVVPAVTEVDEAFTAADAVETELETEEPTYEVLSDAVQTYPEVVAVLDNALENGGVSVEAAALLNIFTQRDGIPADMNVATESYGGYARSQTRIAIESIKDSLRQWWNDLRAWMKEQRERFAAWLKSLFDTTTALRKSAESILQKAEAIETDSDATIDVNGAVWLTKDNAFSKDLPADVRELTDLINRTYLPLATLDMAACGKAGDVIAQLKGDESVETVALELARSFEQSDSAVRSKLTEPGSEDGFRQSRVQLGGYVLRGQVGDNSKEPSLSDMSKGDCLVFTKVTEEVDVKEVKALSRTDIMDVARAVIGLLDAIEETKKLDGPCKAASGKIDAAGEHLAKMGEGDEVANELQTGLRQVVLALEKETVAPFSKSIKYFSAVARAALAVAGKSLPTAAPAADKAEA